MFLEIGPLSASFSHHLLYQDVWLRLRERELALLKGPSGSGKSTLLRQAVGLLPENKAKRLLEGRSYSPEELPLFRRRCLLLLADAPMISGTVEENLRFPFEHRLAETSFNEERARELCQRLGLAHLSWQQSAHTLSLGERHRLALVRALLWEPKVILADEPFTGLDQENLKIAVECLKEFSRQPGHAALVVSHEEIPADRLFLLKGTLKEERR